MERYYQPEIETASREQLLAWQNERLLKQVRHPLRPAPFRLPSAPSSRAGWTALAAVATKNAPAGFGRSEADVLKFFDG